MRFSHIDCHVKHFTSCDANQLTLRLFDLVVQPTQNILNRARVVVLNKIYFFPDNTFKLLMITTFKEKPRSYPNTLGSMRQTSEMARGLALIVRCNISYYLKMMPNAFNLKVLLLTKKTQHDLIKTVVY